MCDDWISDVFWVHKTEGDEIARDQSNCLEDTYAVGKEFAWHGWKCRGDHHVAGSVCRIGKFMLEYRARSLLKAGG